MSEANLTSLVLDSEVEVYIHHQVREEASDLYGFKTLEDLELFNLLLSVSGVGPKSALGILSLAKAGDIKEAIIRGDSDLLIKVSGVGKKTAERLVLELKTKVTRQLGVSSDLSAFSASGSDELNALLALGYSIIEARDALSAVEPEIVDSGARVKAALRRLLPR